MKKLLFIFSVCCLGYSTAFSQDDVYYSETATAPSASVSASITVAPPEIPVYTQPACPYDGYMWTPGYWAWGIGGYYWVPGVWLAPPHYGYLWTPGYWGYAGGFYGWHGGYWGEHIGFYGGVNYGYGYGGSGFYGGRWVGNSFSYNTAVVNVNTTVIHNTYQSNAGVTNTSSRASFNGQGGITVQPNSQEAAAAKEPHVQPTSEQQAHAQAASQDKSAYVSANHGKPANTAMNTTNGQHFSPSGTATKAPAASNGHTSAAPAETHTGATAPKSGETSGEGKSSEAKASAPKQQNSAPKNTAQQHRAAPQQHNSAPKAASHPSGGGGNHGGGRK